jgi:hypothetical protein
MGVVKVESSAGEFVAPTAASITKGLTTMQTRSDGTFAPDPASASPGAYPLTMVEYAFVPTEALIDSSTCAPRTESQAMLKEWLDYLVGAGQANLPEGFLPLTPGLAAQARSAIAQVGATPNPAATAASCPKAPSGTSSPRGAGPGGTAYPGASGFGPGAYGYDGSFAGPVGVFGSSELAALEAPATRADAPEEAARETADDEIELPGMFGIAALSVVGPAAAVVLLIGLTSMTALTTSGRLGADGIRRLARRLRRPFAGSGAA